MLSMAALRFAAQARTKVPAGRSAVSQAVAPLEQRPEDAGSRDSRLAFFSLIFEVNQILARS
jgi:hypothetical protein